MMFRRKPDPFPDDGLTASFEAGDSLRTGAAAALVRTVTLVVLAVLGWSALTPVYEVVSGEGQIEPAGDTARIEHLDGGIVARIAVTEGARVDPGDILIELDGTDLLAERDKLRLLRERAETQATQARGFLAAAPADWHRAAPLSEETGFRLAQIEALRAERAVAQAQRAALDAMLQSARDELRLQGEKERRYASVSLEAISRNDRDAVARDTLRLRGALSQLTGDIAVKDAALALGRANEARLIGEIRADARARLDEAEAEAARAARSLDQVEARIGRLTLVADRPGTVGELSVHHPGQVSAMVSPARRSMWRGC